MLKPILLQAASTDTAYNLGYQLGSFVGKYQYYIVGALLLLVILLFINRRRKKSAR